MPSKHVRVQPIQLSKQDDGSFATSVSVASSDALVVISEIALPSEDTMIAVAIITEDEVDE